MNKKVLFSTDIGSDVDDALALLVMLNAGINLKGIYTVNGDVVSRTYIAKHMMNLAHRNIPVAIGEANSLENHVEPYSNCEDFYVDNSFFEDRDFEKYKPPKKVGVIQLGVEDLAKRLKKEKYVIFNTAPLTNIAKLIQNHPQVLGNIEKLYIM